LSSLSLLRILKIGPIGEEGLKGLNVGVQVHSPVQCSRTPAIIGLLILIIVICISGATAGVLLPSTIEDVGPTCGARLLPLEPRTKTCRMEDVIAGEFLVSRSCHFLPADDAHVVSGGKLLSCSIGI
jgi:hypothetical protein